MESAVDIPIQIDHNRITVEIGLVRGDGTVRSAWAWLDTGGTSLVLAESLAQDLGLDLKGISGKGERSLPISGSAPAISLGEQKLHLDGVPLMVRPGRFSQPGVAAECTLPAPCLRGLHVVFDYQKKRLLLSKSGTQKPSGLAVPIKVNSETGLFMIEAVVNGRKVSLGIDTGSSGSWMSRNLVNEWLTQDPGRPFLTGAAGSTSFFGFPFENQGTLIMLPGLIIGTLPVSGETAILGLDQGLFDWYSQKSAGAVEGFLGGDLLSCFRIEVDLDKQMSWWQPVHAEKQRDLDIVPLGLKALSDGRFSVSGIVADKGKPLVPDVFPGDIILAIDQLDATHMTMGRIFDALRGKPGDKRVLKLLRADRERRVTTEVMDLLIDRRQSGKSAR